MKERVWRSFKEARGFARDLNFKSQKEWLEFSKSGDKPKDIPSSPWTIYKTEWVSIYDWLGYKSKNKIWRPFEEARKFTQKLKLGSIKEWYEFVRSTARPDDIPANPWTVYKTDWISINDWLDYDWMGEKWRSFEEAREFARGLNLSSGKEWREYAKSGDKPKNIPANPRNLYKTEWVSWGDFLGNTWRSFEEARKFVRGLNLSSEKEWREYAKSGDKPKDIPSSPSGVYKTEWVSLRDFLGKRWWSFEEAREFARGLNLSTEKEWREYDKPKNIPTNPASVYKTEWVSWSDFLGNTWRSFEEAREFARSLKLNSGKEWVEYAKSGDKPKDIPSSPSGVYKTEWVSWGDFLGRSWRSFEEAREFARGLEIKKYIEWLEYCKSGDRPEDVPGNPRDFYKTEWVSWGDFLGRSWRSFEEAREFARSLNLTTSREWLKYARSSGFPDDIPVHPKEIYSDKWTNWADWLGYNPNLHKSKGEVEVIDFLESHNINFIEQKKFKNCKDKLPLPFDFFIPKYNLCIEHDGIFHFKKSIGMFFQTKESFEKTKKRDRIKDRFCTGKNGRPNLVRITYKENTEEKLKKIFFDKNLHS